MLWVKKVSKSEIYIESWGNSNQVFIIYKKIMKQPLLILIVFLIAILIAPNVDASVPVEITELNEIVSERSGNWSTGTSSVFVSDHFSNFDVIQDNADGVHPNREGDNKMAAVWTSSLLSSNLDLSKNYSIMPLGDSITALNYRYDLWMNLNEINLTFDFVGSENRLPWAQESVESEFDINHEGHSGWRSDQISYNIESWTQKNTPDIVLFHIGTNDLAQGYSPLHVIEHIEKTIKILQLYNPEVIIYVAQIIPYDFEDYSEESSVGFHGMEISLMFISFLIIEEIIRKHHFNKN